LIFSTKNTAHIATKTAQILRPLRQSHAFWFTNGVPTEDILQARNIKFVCAPADPTPITATAYVPAYSEEDGKICGGLASTFSFRVGTAPPKSWLVRGYDGYFSIATINPEQLLSCEPGWHQAIADHLKSKWTRNA